jgi:hypothetical protein
MYLVIDNNSKELTFNEPDWAQIERSLIEIDPTTNCYLTLASDSRSYIQCAGSQEELTIEIRESKDTTFSHYVVGKGEVKSALRTVWQVINCRAGPIRVHENEVLKLTDALNTFRSFYSKSMLSTEYKKRNVSKEHQG